MNVLISWSGARSKELALTLKDLLPVMIQSLDVWVSDRDIDAGSRWLNELNDQLDQCNFGVVCLTPENLHSDWILYEAGAIAKSVDKARVVSYLLNLKQTDVEAPLSQFQNVPVNKNGTYKLLRSLNNSLEDPMPIDQLKTIFDKFWPDLHNRIKTLPKVENPSKPPGRPDRELLEEILIAVREPSNPKELFPTTVSDIFEKSIISESLGKSDLYKMAKKIIFTVELKLYSYPSLQLIQQELSKHGDFDFTPNERKVIKRAILIIKNYLSNNYPSE